MEGAEGQQWLPKIMIFDNVNLMGYSHENNFMGENSFVISCTKVITIQGYILDLMNSNGVKKVFGGAMTLLNEAKNLQEVIINGEPFGFGKVTELSIDSGNWVRTTQYKATLNVKSTFDLQQNKYGTEFNGLNILNKKLYLIKDLSESLTLNFDSHNRVLEGEHSVDVQYDANDTSDNLDLIALAQNLGYDLLKTLPSSLATGVYTYRTDHISTYSETYDLIAGKCGFQKSFSYNTGNNTTKPYSVNRDFSLNLSEDGIATVTEKCSIKAESNTPSKEDNLLLALREQLEATVSPNPASRCTNFFNNYITKFGLTGAPSLNTTYIVEKTTQINKFEGTADYTITFTNDQKNANNTYSFERSITLNRDNSGIWTAAEDGSIKGLGKKNTNERYTNASTGWTNIKSGIFSRVNGYYNLDAKDKSGAGLKNTNKNVTKKIAIGEISYSYSYSDDPAITGAQKFTVERSDSGLMPIVKDYIIPNRKYALQQNVGKLKLGEHKVSVKLEVGCVSADQQFRGLDYLASMKLKAGFNRNSFTGPHKDQYLESASFTSDEIEKTLTYEEIYKYS